MAVLIRKIALALLLGLPATAPAATVGEPAPAFELERLEGGTVSLSDLQGREILLDIWASWCAVCEAALPLLDEIARDRPDLAVVAVTVDRDRAEVERFLARVLPERKITILLDPRGTLPARYGAPAMPTLYLVDATGIIRAVEGGYRAGVLDELRDRRPGDPAGAAPAGSGPES